MFDDWYDHCINAYDDDSPEVMAAISHAVSARYSSDKHTCFPKKGCEMIEKGYYIVCRLDDTDFLESRIYYVQSLRNTLDNISGALRSVADDCLRHGNFTDALDVIENLYLYREN